MNIRSSGMGLGPWRHTCDRIRNLGLMNYHTLHFYFNLVLLDSLFILWEFYSLFILLFVG